MLVFHNITGELTAQGDFLTDDFHQLLTAINHLPIWCASMGEVLGYMTTAERSS